MRDCSLRCCRPTVRCDRLACVCARQLVVVVVRCILCRSVASLRFFVFRFSFCHRCRASNPSFVRRDCIGESLILTQILFDFVRRLIRLDDVFSFDFLGVTGDCVR